MSVSDTVASAVGPGAGFVARTVANGDVAAGTVVVVTGGDTDEDIVVSVSFGTDPNALAEDNGGTAPTFVVSQTTGTGLGATLSHTVQQTGYGFSVTATAVPTVDTLYVFTWTS